MASITHLFLDIGGVLLTNGWDRAMRKEAARHIRPGLRGDGRAPPPDVRHL